MNIKKRLIYIFVLLYIFTYKLFLCNYEILEGSIKCIDEGVYKTCIYENIYYTNKKWIIYSNNHKYTNICINAFPKSLAECWKTYVYPINNKQIKIVKIEKVYSRLSVPFRLTYEYNYGHAFWDDLYSIYASIVKVGYKNESFNLIIHNMYKYTHFLKDIYSVIEKFSKGKNIYIENVNNKTLLFKKLIVGSSHQCQRCITFDYTLKYSREYNMTKIIRDRMYEVYNIKPKYILPIEGIIVHNKRYSQYEIDILKNVIYYFNKNKILKLTYIDFKNITSFYQQLILLSKVHIYISGPGSGLLNFPFISDPGAIIHLGHIHFGCPQYLEQYILEGSPHYKTYYYSPQKRMEKLDYLYIITLIKNAVEYITENRNIYVKKEENLNLVGKLFVEICKDHKRTCMKLKNYYDWGYGKCRGIWAENVVYFPSLYTRIPELRNIVYSYSSRNNLGCKIGIGYSKQKQCK